MALHRTNFGLSRPFRSRVRSRHATDRQTDTAHHFIMPSLRRSGRDKWLSDIHCIIYTFVVLQVKIWFQNRRARERRGKDAVMSSAQPLPVTAGNNGANSVTGGVEDHRRQIAGSISGLICTSAADADTVDGRCSTISPFTLDDCSDAGRGVLTAESLIRRPFLQSEAVAESRRFAAPSSTASAAAAAAAAMMRATLDCCRPSWTVGIPRHHLTPPVTSLTVPAVAAAADLLAHLSSMSSSLNAGQPLSTAFPPPSVNLLRF